MFVAGSALSVQADIAGWVTLLDLIEAGCCSWPQALEVPTKRTAPSPSDPDPERSDQAVVADHR